MFRFPELGPSVMRVFNPKSGERFRDAAIVFLRIDPGPLS
jgi:hypothetical protein